MEAPTVEDIPEHFYKYRSLAGSQSEFTEKIIINSELYWASPLTFNDPFDCAPVHVLAGSKMKKALAIRRIIRDGFPFISKREVRARTAEALRRPPEEIEKMMSQMQSDFMKEIGVCCLSTIPDNILMWSHYANSHTGICLRFTPGIKKNNSLSDLEDIHFELSFPVKYSEIRPKIDILWKERNDILEKMLLTKADFWSYEHEWRMFRHDVGPGAKKFPSRCLDGIIFGARSTKKERQMVDKWLQDRPNPVNLYQAKFSEKLFRLEIEEI